MADVEAFTNSSEDLRLNHSNSEYRFEYEYYEYEYDVSFEGLQVNKYSIVIAFWVGLAVFMIFLFIILMIMSRSGFAQVQSNSSRRTSAGKHNKQVQEEANITNCAVSTLLPANVGNAGM
ncbi:melanocortin-2 receptor accessory protein 2B [Callorhinchus milii]|uniref:melanocortin-2 receptor accessory protein 2B n=1 Tax=Callorhinchus milii TaxID=7868 RepID=UPI001C3FD77C|nr:melanocortin-2 receptor accessory protein 2B [Callorhinchus milii]